MTSTILKYNAILIVLCIGMTLIQNSSGEKVKKDIDLYYDPTSPSCRSVLLTLEALHLEFNLINIGQLTNKQHTEDFLKKIYKYNLPVIQEGDFFLSESHAIIVYLVREYGGEDVHHLYPDDPKLQAQVNQILHFDNGTLYLAFKNQYNPWNINGIPKTKEREDKIHEALKFLESVLRNSPWAAGESMTVADFSLVASITTFKVAGVYLSKYEKIMEWLKKCKNTMVGYEVAIQEEIVETAKQFKMNINLFYDPVSPLCRAVLLTLKALNLELNLIHVRTFKKIRQIEDFCTIHSKLPVPVMQIGDFVLSESPAIIVYLVREYGGKNEHSLYPNDPKLRALVNQILYFNNGTLYPAFKIQYEPWIFLRRKKTSEREDKIHEALMFLENVLKTSSWAAGESMTVADFSLVASISTLKVAGVNLTKYYNIREWFLKCNYTMVGYEKANLDGIYEFDDVLISKGLKH